MRFRGSCRARPLGKTFSASWSRGSAGIMDPRSLDLVLTPLVAFDSRGTRIGVGRGYYDRAFRFLRHRGAWRRPKLLGVAYELQHVPKLENPGWDMPLWGAVTEARMRRFEAPVTAMSTG